MLRGLGGSPRGLAALLLCIGMAPVLGPSALSADEGRDLLRREETPFLFLRQAEPGRSRIVLAVWEDGTWLQRRSRSLGGDGYLLGTADAATVAAVRDLVERAEADAPSEEGRLTVCSDCPNEIHRTVSMRWDDRRWLRTWRVEAGSRSLEERLWSDLLRFEPDDARKIKLPDADTPTEWYWR